MSQASPNVPQLGDLMAIFTANAAQAAQTQSAVSDQIRNQAAYAMQTDNRLVTGAVAVAVAAASEPDTFAGLNSGVRVPVTLDQPGTWPANQQVKAAS